MLDTTVLRPSDRYYHKGKPLIYERTWLYHVLKDRSGKEKRLSQPITQRDAWIEIFVGGIVASPKNSDRLPDPLQGCACRKLNKIKEF